MLQLASSDHKDLYARLLAKVVEGVALWHPADNPDLGPRIFDCGYFCGGRFHKLCNLAADELRLVLPSLSRVATSPDLYPQPKLRLIGSSKVWQSPHSGRIKADIGYRSVNIAGTVAFTPSLPSVAFLNCGSYYLRCTEIESQELRLELQQYFETNVVAIHAAFCRSPTVKVEDIVLIYGTSGTCAWIGGVATSHSDQDKILNLSMTKSIRLRTVSQTDISEGSENEPSQFSVAGGVAWPGQLTYGPSDTIDPAELVHCAMVKCIRVLKREWLLPHTLSSSLRIASERFSKFLSYMAPPSRAGSETSSSTPDTSNGSPTASNGSSTGSTSEAAHGAANFSDPLYQLMRESLERHPFLGSVSADYSVLRKCEKPNHSGHSLRRWTTSRGVSAATLLSNCTCDVPKTVPTVANLQDLPKEHRVYSPNQAIELVGMQMQAVQG